MYSCPVNITCSYAHDSRVSGLWLYVARYFWATGKMRICGSSRW